MPETRTKFRVRMSGAHKVLFKQIAFMGLGDIYDISLGGMRIQTSDAIEPGAVKLQFKFPFMKRIETVHGSVVWVNKENTSCGVVFHYLDKRQNETIRKFQLLQFLPEHIN